MSSYYTHDADKQSGDGLAMSDWNDLSSAVAGNSGLHLAINSSDHVGIGIENPNTSHKLHVKSSAGIGLFESTDSEAILRLSTNEGWESRVEFCNRGNGRAAIWVSDGDDALSISRNGHVGIGTTDPSHQFHVKSSSVVGLFESANNEAILQLSTNAGINRRVEFCNRAEGRAAIWVSEGDDALNVLANGDVGIGTTDPSHQFHVKSSAVVGLFESTDNEAILRLSTNAGTDQRVEFCNRGAGRAAIWVSEAGDALSVLANGNVGIGTNTPSEKLRVEGNIQATRFIGDGSQLTNLSIGDTGLNLAIASDSKVGIGTTNPQDKLEVNGPLRLNTVDNFLRMSLSSQQLIFEIHNSQFGSATNRRISWDGDTNWDALSDKKLKTDIENEGNILERLLRLDVKNYRWTDDPERKNKMIGFIAQDVEPIFPALVGKIEDPEAKESTLTLKYANFGVLAVGAIKELKQEYDQRLAALEKEIAGLKALLEPGR